ncbi:15-hydroxyprostaglandin dehydrogenase [NAD(+)]-like [Epargyreus clarus]|uniref:15-hydroxyprostaglandin dehydrogenase [NAD(+)]-like n=1 Tax=Epargyreus clarus TaxID=520877 RepID=UPI003C2BF822
MANQVKNKVALVTGGSSGLGLAMVEEFLKKGAKVLIIVDINEQQGTDATKAMNLKYGDGKAVFYKCDVAVDLDATFEKITDVYKTVDVVVNNAGVLNEKSIRKTIDVNVVALMEWTMKFYEYMRVDKGGNGGTIINVSSIYGYRIIPFIPYYQGSKFAVLGFSKSLGNEYHFKKTGVRVVVLCPGLTHTSMCENPKPWAEDSMPDFMTEVQNTEWQNADAIGRGTVEIFEQAESGTAWLVEGSRPAVMV